MSEAVSVPRLMMMTSIVSEESLARDTHTDTACLVYENKYILKYKPNNMGYMNVQAKWNKTYKTEKRKQHEPQTNKQINHFLCG